MQGGGVGPADVGDAAFAEPRQYPFLDDFSAERGGSGLQVIGSVLVHEAPGEVRHGGAAGLAGRLPFEVAPGSGQRDDLCGTRPGGRRRDGTVRSNGGLDCASLADHPCTCYDGWRSGSPICVRNLSLARRFVRHLVRVGIVDDPPGEEAAEPVEAVAWFDWLDKHRGLSKPTLHIYRTVFRELARLIGLEPAHYDAARIRSAILDYEGTAAVEHRTRVLRSWLRYNAMLGKCPASLEGAVPPIRTRRPSRLPRGLRAGMSIV